MTRKPHRSSVLVRTVSRHRSISVECVAPSTSTTSLPSRVTKSTTYPSIGCWRRNFQRASLRLRSAYHSFASALVCEARSCRALCLNRSIPLTRRLRRRPLPNGERYDSGNASTKAQTGRAVLPHLSPLGRGRFRRSRNRVRGLGPHERRSVHLVVSSLSLTRRLRRRSHHAGGKQTRCTAA